MADIQDTPPVAGPALSEPAVSPIMYKAPEGVDDITAQKALVDKHVSRSKAWLQWRQPYQNVWYEIYKLYVASTVTQKVVSRSKVVVPVAFQIIESALPKILNVLFGSPEWFSATPRSQNKPVDQRILNAKTDLLKYQLEKTDFFTKFLLHIKQLMMYGTSYLFVYQKVERQWVQEATPIRQNMTYMGTVLKENALVWDRKTSYKVTNRCPEIEVLDIDDVIPDPDSKTLCKGRGVYVRDTIDFDEFKELCSGRFPVYTNLEAVEQTLKAKEDSQVRSERRAARGVGAPSPAARGRVVDLLTWWGLEDLDGDGVREETQVVIANGSVLVKAIRNPFDHQKRPVIGSSLFPVPGEPLGMGLIEPVIPLIRELCTLRNQNIDMNNLIINRMWSVNQYSGVDLASLISEPNGIILRGDNPSDVEALHQDPIPVSPTEMSQLVQSDIDNTAVPKSIQGSAATGAVGRTARGARLVIEQALEKFGVIAKLVEGSIREALSMMDALNSQFLDSDETLQEFYGDLLRDPQNGQMRIKPEELPADVLYTISGVSETVTSEASLNQMTAFINTFKGMQPDPQSGQSLSWLEIATIYWKLMRLNFPVPLTQVQVQMEPPADANSAVGNQVAQNGQAPIQVPQ